MKSPFFKRTLPIAAMCVILFVLVIMPNLDSMFLSNTRYSQCSDMVKTDPAGALELAKDWRKQFPDSLLGKHCEAVALYATRSYVPAADEFMELAGRVKDNDRLLAGRLYRQASVAYAAAGKTDQSKQADADAIIITQPPIQHVDKK